jgi:hypothetical protein
MGVVKQLNIKRQFLMINLAFVKQFFLFATFFKAFGRWAFPQEYVSSACTAVT